MSTGKTISSLLEDALDLIGKEETTGNEESATVSASKQLLAERSKGKRGIDSEDFVSFTSNKKATVATPLMAQISDSSVDDPKYWKTAPSKSKALHQIKTMKFSHGSTNQNKATKQRTSKGEQYNDKYSAKLENRNKKNNLRKILKA